MPTTMKPEEARRIRQQLATSLEEAGIHADIRVICGAAHSPNDRDHHSISNVDAMIVSAGDAADIVTERQGGEDYQQTGSAMDPRMPSTG